MHLQLRGGRTPTQYLSTLQKRNFSKFTSLFKVITPYFCLFSWITPHAEINDFVSFCLILAKVCPVNAEVFPLLSGHKSNASHPRKILSFWAFPPNKHFEFRHSLVGWGTRTWTATFFSSASALKRNIKHMEKVSRSHNIWWDLRGWYNDRTWLCFERNPLAVIFLGI